MAEARVRPIEGVGVEIRYEWDGELRASQVFKSWEELEASATEKRRELEARGWHSESNGSRWHAALVPPLASV